MLSLLGAMRLAGFTLYLWRKLFIATALFSVVISLSVILQSPDQVFSLGDILSFLFLGTEPIYSPDVKSIFRVPLLWLAFLVYVFFAAAVSTKAMSNAGLMAMLISCGSRSHYLHISSIVSILGIIIHFVLFVAIAAFCCLVFGGSMATYPTEFFAATYLPQFDWSMGATSFTAIALFVPMLASIAMATAQHCISLFIDLPKSMIAVIAILVVSVFFTSYLLPGNYLMLLRCDAFVALGLNFAFGVAVLFFYIVVFYWAARFKVKSQDFIF